MTTATETKPAAAKEAKAPKPVAAPKHCLCGCGELVNPKRNFKQGHDQRLVATLARNLVEDGGSKFGFDQLPDAWTTDDLAERITRAGRVVGDKYSDGLVSKFESAAGNLAKKETARRTRETRKAAKAAEKATAKETPAPAESDTPAEHPQLGAKIKVKIGNRSKVYDATVTGMNQAGKATQVEYDTASGTKQTDNFTIVG